MNICFTKDCRSSSSSSSQTKSLQYTLKTFDNVLKNKLFFFQLVKEKSMLAIGLVKKFSTRTAKCFLYEIENEIKIIYNFRKELLLVLHV